MPVAASAVANRVASLPLNKLKSAKPRQNTAGPVPPRPQMQNYDDSRSPQYRPNSGVGNGVQITQKYKKLEELNENIQCIQSMIGSRADEQLYNADKKKPFAILNNNAVQPPRHDASAKNEIQDIKMELQELEDDRDDRDGAAQGLEQICQDHETLVNIILQEEEDLLASHRKYIDDVVESVKKQMMILHEVDKPGSNVEEYISSLDSMLLGNMDMIKALRRQVLTFNKHLKEEEHLSKKFYEQQMNEPEDDDMDEDYYEQTR